LAGIHGRSQEWERYEGKCEIPVVFEKLQLLSSKEREYILRTFSSSPIIKHFFI
jgi:hypothetical protein